MAAKDDLGRYGEDLAAAFLRGQGMTLIERNWRCDRGELDIIAGDGDCLVECGVKTRSSQAYGTPLEAVSGRKLARLRVRAALASVRTLTAPSGAAVDHAARTRSCSNDPTNPTPFSEATAVPKFADVIGHVKGTASQVFSSTPA